MGCRDQLYGLVFRVRTFGEPKRMLSGTTSVCLLARQVLLGPRAAY